MKIRQKGKCGVETLKKLKISFLTVFVHLTSLPTGSCISGVKKGARLLQYSRLFFIVHCYPELTTANVEEQMIY